MDYIATSHMFANYYFFTSYQPLINDKYITVSGRNCVPVVGIGSVTLTMILLNSASNLTFTNTLYIPSLGTDLISLGVFHYKGTSVQSWKKGLIISKDGENLFSAILGRSTGILYQVQYFDIESRSAFIVEKSLSLCLWHC